MCCVARTVAEIHETVQDIVAFGGQGLAVPTDVTQLSADQNMVQVTVETFGGLDILVINAGVSGQGRHVEDSHPEAWRSTLEVNLLGAYCGVKTFLADASLAPFARFGGHRSRAGVFDQIGER